ncbi:MAG TPA: hypothetical protein VIE88_19305, partial [Vicinamibacteria bacterium]
GGGAGFRLCGGGGGGGGSSLAAGGLESLTAGDPKIAIIYNPPPTAEITTPTEGAVYTQGQAVNVSFSCLAGEGTSLKSCSGENWSGPVANGGPLDTSTVGEFAFSVLAEDLDEGQGSASVAYSVVPKKEEPTPPGPTPSGGGSNPVPNTTLGKHPKKTIKSKKKKVKVKFSFSSDVAGATFQCKLDKKSFAPCTSPKTYKVKRGKHTFSVEAIGTGGTDATPATFKFKVKKKK